MFCFGQNEVVNCFLFNCFGFSVLVHISLVFNDLMLQIVESQSSLHILRVSGVDFAGVRLAERVCCFSVK